ncbi:unnamed protein product [Prunus brigantina]
MDIDNENILDFDGGTQQQDSPNVKTPIECSIRVENEDENQEHTAQPTDEEPNQDSGRRDDNSQNKRKLRSVVWNHFKKQKIGDVWKVVCNNCGKKLLAGSKNGTTHLHDCFKICPLRKQRDIKQSLLHPTKSNDGGVKLGTYNFDQQNARKELACMIILHEYPMSMVEHVGFRRYSMALQPLFKMVSQNTIKGDIFKIFEYERERTMKLLETNQNRIAITTDMWTSNNQKKGFMAVTSHFIDESWNLQSRLVR